MRCAPLSLLPLFVVLSFAPACTKQAGTPAAPVGTPDAGAGADPGASPGASACLALGSTCASPEQCCSGACPGAKCGEASQCAAPGGACTVGSDCCSGSCSNA